jgi:hypothetical protein
MEKILEEFKSLIQERDAGYKSKIDFSISPFKSYDKPGLKVYEAEITPLNGTNLQHYFKNTLGGQDFVHEAYNKGIFSLKLRVN